MINSARVETLKKRNEVILSTIDTLLDIRLTLTVKKLIEKTISKLDLKKIVDKAKEGLDSLVKNEIDDAFKTYFEVKDDDPISFNEMKESFEDKGEEKGKALSFNNGHFNNNNNNASDLPKAG